MSKLRIPRLQLLAVQSRPRADITRQGPICFGSKADHNQNVRVDRLAPVSQ